MPAHTLYSVLGAPSRLCVRVHPGSGVRGRDGVDGSAVLLSRQKRHRHAHQGVRYSSFLVDLAGLSDTDAVGVCASCVSVVCGGLTLQLIPCLSYWGLCLDPVAAGACASPAPPPPVLPAHTVRSRRVGREPRAGLHRCVWLRDGDQGRCPQYDRCPVGRPRLPGQGGESGGLLCTNGA